MSRKLLAFLLSELSTVRIKCVKCKGIVEVETVDQVVVMFSGPDDPKCPLCKQLLIGPGCGSNNPMRNLAVAVAELKKRSDTVEIEFVLADKGEPEPKK